jgi:hypothetical protein
VPRLAAGANLVLVTENDDFAGFAFFQASSDNLGALYLRTSYDYLISVRYHQYRAQFYFFALFYMKQFGINDLAGPYPELLAAGCYYCVVAHFLIPVKKQ